MPAANAFSWDLYLVTGTDVDQDGFQLAQPDLYGAAGADHIETMFPYGCYGRPMDPVVDPHGTIDVGCPMLVAFEGGKTIGFPMTDKRAVAKVPKLKPGEFMNYGPASNFVRLHADGTIAMFCTSDGTVTGQSIYSAIGPTGSIESAPWGKQTFDRTGYHVRTTSGARLDLGGIAGMPFPLDQLSSYAHLSAGSIKIQSAIISFGPDAGVHEPVAKATTLDLYLSGLEAALAVFIAAIAPKTGIFVTGADVAAAAIVFTASVSALQPLKLALQSTSTTVA